MGSLNWGRYYGGPRPTSDDSFHSPAVIPPLALDKPSLMKRYHRRRTTRSGVTARSPTIVTFHDTRFVECRWWLVGCLTSQQHASVSQGRICSDNFTCCHTEIQVADPIFHLTQSQYTDTGLTSPSADPITPGACRWWNDGWTVKTVIS